MQNLSTNRSSREGKGCFEPDEIAELPDMYVNCHMGSTSELVRPDSTEVRVFRSGVGINTNFRDHSMQLKEGSPILLLLRLEWGTAPEALGVAGGVSQRITPLKTALRVGKPGGLHVTATGRRLMFVLSYRQTVRLGMINPPVLTMLVTVCCVMLKVSAFVLPGEMLSEHNDICG